MCQTPSLAAAALPAPDAVGPLCLFPQAAAQGAAQQEDAAQHPIFSPYRRDALSDTMLNFEESTAVHEAGHAVVAYVLGWPIRSVTIVPDPARQLAGHVATWDDPAEPDVILLAESGAGAGGAVEQRRANRRLFARRAAHYRRWTVEPEVTFLVDSLMVAAAGHEACVHLVTRGYDYWTATEHDDRQLQWAVASVLSRYLHVPTVAVRDQWVQHVRWLLRLPAIERGVAMLAQALLKWRLLDGVQVDGVLCDLVPTGRRAWDPLHRAAPLVATGWRPPPTARSDQLDAAWQLSGSASAPGPGRAGGAGMPVPCPALRVLADQSPADVVGRSP